MDVPETVLGQLGNRVQHALRAFTPRDQKAVRAAAETFRSNPKLDVATEITQLAVGEALVSFLDAKGTPGVVERALVFPPHGQIGPITPEERSALMQSSLVAGVYDEPIDRESAYERLKQRSQPTSPVAGAAAAPGNQPLQPTSGSAPGGGLLQSLQTILVGSTGPRGGHHEGALEAMVRSGARTMGSQIVRGVLGSILGGKR